MKSMLSLNRAGTLQSHQNYHDSRPYYHKYTPFWCKTRYYISILRVLLSYGRIYWLLFCHILRVGLSFPLHSMNLRMGNECGVFHAKMCIPFLSIDEFRKLLFYLMVIIFFNTSTIWLPGYRLHPSVSSELSTLLLLMIGHCLSWSQIW